MERISLRALDELTWACVAIMRACISKGEIFFRKSDGSTVSGPLHAYRAQDKTRCEPVVKTTDLRAAYKQFAICPQQQRVCVVTLKDPSDGKAKGFVCRVLPFGALASVGQFNRFSRLWQRILWELKLAASSYFDDFPAAEVRALASNRDASVKAALHLFGVDWADDKDLPFAQQADVLGVTLDASDMSRGVVRVMNKRERARDIASSIQQVLEDGCIDPRQIPSLFGRIQFSESQLMGRQGRLALAQIRKLAEARHKHVLTPLEISAFENLRARMLSGRPREIPVRLEGGRTYVFTDGACDKNDNGFSCAIGGVLYRVLSSGAYETRASGCDLDEAVVSTWAGAGKPHLIGPTELYAVVAARGVWKKFLDNERAIFFVDHSGVLSAMIKGSSRDDVWRSLLLHYEHFDAEGFLSSDRFIKMFSSASLVAKLCYRRGEGSNEVDPDGDPRFVFYPEHFISGVPIELKNTIDKLASSTPSEELLEASGHQDKSIVGDIAEGFKLSGPIPATADELRRGWLFGPVDEKDLPAEAVVTRRFGIRQGGKCRPIDNYLESGVNATASASDTITVHTADVLAAALSYRIHKLRVLRKPSNLTTRAWDLAKAYKNLALHPESISDGYLAVWNPDSQITEIYGQRVLPFGARSSVHSFCRTSLGIWIIGVCVFLLRWGVYFDDFVGSEVPCLSKLFELCADCLFMILGWTTSSDKASTFDPIAKVLGLKINLKESGLGLIYFENTEHRRDELVGFIEEVLLSSFLSRKDGERLRGRLQFAEQQISGKRAGLAFKELSRHVAKGGGKLGPGTLDALGFLKQHVACAPARCIADLSCFTWHLYVDASNDDSRAGIGGILISESGAFIGHFSEYLDEATLTDLNAAGSENPIFELECFAIWCGIHVWAQLFRYCHLIVFTDNEGALHSMVNGRSENDAGSRMVSATHALLDDCFINPWFERVNTSSNLADYPSRGISKTEWGARISIDFRRLARVAKARIEVLEDQERQLSTRVRVLESDSPDGRPPAGGSLLGTLSGASSSSGPADVGPAIAFAHQSLPSAGLKHCWEEGFWACIFDSPRDAFDGAYGTVFKRPEAPVVDGSEMPPLKVQRPGGLSLGAADGSQSFLNAVRDREVLTWKQKRGKERSEALALWLALILTWPAHIVVVGQLLRLSHDSRASMIEDLLGHKAPKTLRKRYRSILGYDGYLRDRSTPFPGTEAVFYGYLCLLREECKPASTRKALLEAITFTRFVLGITELAPL
ncbi:unnamed protein product, partial [Symbiodinium sp. CCMP2456]